MRPIPREAYRGSQSGHSGDFLRIITERVMPPIISDMIIFSSSNISTL